MMMEAKQATLEKLLGFGIGSKAFCFGEVNEPFEVILGNVGTKIHLNLGGGTWYSRFKCVIVYEKARHLLPQLLVTRIPLFFPELAPGRRDVF